MADEITLLNDIDVLEDEISSCNKEITELVAKEGARSPKVADAYKRLEKLEQELDRKKRTLKALKQQYTPKSEPEPSRGSGMSM
jgi:septal ring factor EnvC (AmiA/AmiB activator)